MKLCYLTPNWKPLKDTGLALGDLGYTLVDDPAKADIVLLMSVSQMGRLPVLPERTRLFVYNWDWYDWALEKHSAIEYDWVRFAALCKAATEVWNPSQSELARYIQRTGAENGAVVTSPAAVNDLPDAAITDGGFVLDTLRKTPDPFWGLAIQACKTLNIPLIQPQHKLSFDAYCQLLASCTMTVSTLREASTGGLGLVEAAWYGKPCVIPDNQENAASEYAPWGVRYTAGDARSLAQAIYTVWVSRPFEGERLRPALKARYSPAAIAAEMDAAIKKYANWS